MIFLIKSFSTIRLIILHSFEWGWIDFIQVLNYTSVNSSPMALIVLSQSKIKPSLFLDLGIWITFEVISTLPI